MEYADQDLHVLSILGIKLRQKIIEARKGAGLDIESLAEKSGISFQDITDIESGERIAELSELSKILDACDYFSEEHIMLEKGVCL